MSAMDDDDLKIQGIAEHKWSFAVRLDEDTATLCVEGDGDEIYFTIGTLTHPSASDGKLQVEIDESGTAMFIAETVRAALTKSKKIH